MKQAHDCEIVKLTEMAPGLFDLYIKNENITKGATPGQFVNIKCADEINTLLRRPISICDVNGDVMRIAFQVKGNGTKALSEKKVGETVNIMGPLGRGFTVDENHKKCAVIGGGIGIFPLFFLLKNLKSADAYLGFRTKSLIVMEDEFKKYSDNVNIATDDGSYGYNGFAINCLNENIKDYDMVYACGPKPMLKEVKRCCEEAGVLAQLSLEERMACGIGSCLGCACKINGRYNHVCKGGPVFKASEVDFDD